MASEPAAGADSDPTTHEQGANPVVRVYRSVSPRSEPRGDGSMDAIGVGLFVGLLFLLLPMLPLLITVWLVSKVMEALADR